MSIITQGLSQLSLDDHIEEQMAHQAPDLAITADECEKIARLARRIAQVVAEREGRVLPAGLVVKPWREMQPQERALACATVLRILQSMSLLGWFQAPDPIDLHSGDD